MKTVEKQTIFVLYIFCLFFVIKSLVNRITVQVSTSDIRILDLFTHPVLHFLIHRNTAGTRTFARVRVSKTVHYTTTCVITKLPEWLDNQWPASNHTLEKKIPLVRNLALIETYVLMVDKIRYITFSLDKSGTRFHHALSRHVFIEFKHTLTGSET